MESIEPKVSDPVNNPVTNQTSVPLWAGVLFPLMAGGMAWGIRGQYGHETGAMLAGLLIGLVVTLMYCKSACSQSTFRAIALFALGIGFGGSMTYGQTIGLTQNQPVIGNWNAWSWGMLGLAIKGGLWIGFGGAFLGMGLGGKRYRFLEMAAILAFLMGLFYAGIYLFNEPYDPAAKKLPFLYFSANWTWEPGEQLKPRREVWGGYALGLMGLVLYTAFFRKDGMAPRLAIWGFLGGMVGFPLGQCLQSYHAWNLESIRHGSFGDWDKLINWWNMMETTFGATMGAILGFGVWLHQNQIRFPKEPEELHSRSWKLISSAEALLMLLHVALLVGFEFGSNRFVTWLYQYGIPMAALPLLAVSLGNRAGYFQVLPVLCIPIAGKTLMELTYKNAFFSLYEGWASLVVFPMWMTTALAIWVMVRSKDQKYAVFSLQGTLLTTVWIYFWLNFAFFRFPWPWQTWTARTPNAIIYFAFATGLTALALAISQGPAHPIEKPKIPTG